MSVFFWPRSDAVPVVVTAEGADGTNVYYRDLRPGRDKATTIELPDGTRVKIERPQRERVDFSQYRTARHAPQPPRSTWRDDSVLIMWWRTWLAERSGRRAARELQHDRQGGAAT